MNLKLLKGKDISVEQLIDCFSHIPVDSWGIDLDGGQVFNISSLAYVVCKHIEYNVAVLENLCPSDAELESIKSVFEKIKTQLHVISVKTAELDQDFSEEMKAISVFSYELVTEASKLISLDH